MAMRWTEAIEKLKPWTDEPVEKDENGTVKYGKLEYPVYRGELKNIIYPLGFQPFMRCHMQYGYGIYMRNPQPLQYDFEFEKLRFRHNEKLSQKVFEHMKGGDLIYPHEGLKEAQFIIDQIKNATTFSEEAFQYALYRSHFYKLDDADRAQEDLSTIKIDGKKVEISKKHPWKISSGRRMKIDAHYSDFSVEKWYGISIIDRKQVPGPSPFFEPWMLPDINSGEGVKDFRLRAKVECGNSIVTRNAISLLSTLKYAKMSDF